MSRSSQQVPMHAIKTKEMSSLGFGIINLHDNGGKAYDSEVPHRHTFFELLFFPEALGGHEIDFDNYSVENSSVHFVSPGQIHKLSLKKNNGYVLCFTEDFVSVKSNERFIDLFPFYNNSNHPVLKLNKKLCTQIEKLIISLNDELRSGAFDNLDICRSYLNIILLKLRSHFYETVKRTKQNAGDKKIKVTLFKNLIDKHYLLHKSVSDYANSLSLTPNYLNALCKKLEGKTATQLIQERVLLESKRLLYASDMNIKEISFYLQFEDVPYFNRFFKKLTKLTPLEFRNYLQEKSLKSASI